MSGSGRKSQMILSCFLSSNHSSCCIAASFFACLYCLLIFLYCTIDFHSTILIPMIKQAILIKIIFSIVYSMWCLRCFFWLFFRLRRESNIAKKIINPIPPIIRIMSFHGKSFIVSYVSFLFFTLYIFIFKSQSLIILIIF